MFLMVNPTSPNKVTEYLNLFVLYLLLCKYIVGEIIHECMNDNDKVF